MGETKVPPSEAGDLSRFQGICGQTSPFLAGLEAELRNLVGKTEDTRTEEQSL